jgi:hypothetical protein
VSWSLLLVAVFLVMGLRRREPTGALHLAALVVTGAVLVVLYGGLGVHQ